MTVEIIVIDKNPPNGTDGFCGIYEFFEVPAIGTIIFLAKEESVPSRTGKVSNVVHIGTKKDSESKPAVLLTFESEP